MSLVEDTADYIAAELAGWVVDTNLFMSDEPADSPDMCTVVRTSPGSRDSESGLKGRSIQVIVKNTAPVTCEEDAEDIYELLANKPGFGGIADVFYCEAINAPYPLGQDERGRWIFVFTLLFRKL
jgi:hypothetical protein